MSSVSSGAGLSTPLYPLTFRPVFQKRVWGGRKLAELYGKALPEGCAIGESWEIADRPDCQSVVAEGPLEGNTLGDLLGQYRQSILGSVKPAPGGRFPLLLKILDAREALSLQVHPPPRAAELFGGEPKSELWYLADATPSAHIYAGLKKGVTRAEFASRASDPDIINLCHRLEVRTGDAIFLPSGRLHAVGGGAVIFEIQQNSDTTYRVFDWKRAGAGTAKRELHWKEALESIDFDDHSPGLIRTSELERIADGRQALLRHPLFDVDLLSFSAGTRVPLAASRLQIVAILRGTLFIQHARARSLLKEGDFALVPAALPEAVLHAQTPGQLLHILPGVG